MWITICPLNGLKHTFSKPDALPDAQPTMSMQRKQNNCITEVSLAAVKQMKIDNKTHRTSAMECLSLPLTTLSTASTVQPATNIAASNVLCHIHM